MADDDAQDAGRGTPEEGTSLAPVPARGPRWLRGLRAAARSRGDVGAGGSARGTGAGTDGSDERTRRTRVRLFLGAVADRIVEVAPRVQVRDLEALRAQFPGLGPEEIADRLVSGALKGSATVGAGVGAAAMLPVPPAMPTELAAEIVGVATIELKLIAELHEVYGRRAPGGLQQRTVAYLGAWTSERGIDLTKPATVNAALGMQLRRELRQRLVKRTVRNLPSLAPFMIGAAVGAVMNRRDTAKLAARVREDLRRVQVAWDALPSAEAAAGRGLPPAGPAAPRS